MSTIGSAVYEEESGHQSLVEGRTYDLSTYIIMLRGEKDDLVELREVSQEIMRFYSTSQKDEQ